MFEKCCIIGLNLIVCKRIQDRRTLLTVFYHNKEVRVWEISKDKELPEWVQHCFDNNSMVWYDNKLKVLVKAINPSSKRDVKLGLLDTALGYYGGGFVMGNVGDIFDSTNGRIISKKNFLNHYDIRN